MAKPIREFNANEGDYSIGLAGPDAIEIDIDKILRMFDPLTTHDTGEQGGIGEENIQDNAITDRLIGEREINDNIKDEYTNIGLLNVLLSLIARSIKELKGTESWYTSPSESIDGIVGRLLAINDSIENIILSIDNHKNSGDHDDRYYTKEQLEEHLPGGDTQRKEEVYTIVSADNGDGTFVYTDGTKSYIGELTPEGHQVFTLNNGSYSMDNNTLTVWISDTLRRSKKSGGVNEISPISFALTQPEKSGTEITIEYYERVGMAGEHNIIYSKTKPLSTKVSTMWFEVLD